LNTSQVPEPATYAMLLSGLIGLLAFRRMRSRSLATRDNG